MRFNETDAKKYPLCAYYIKHMLSQNMLRHRKQVYDAFIKACGNQKMAEDALSFSSNPRIHVGALLLKKGKKQICGHNMPNFANANYVVVQGLWFDAFERGSRVDREKNMIRLESTILHETVHYVRHQAGLMDEDWDNFPDHPMEAGNQFTKWAYGRSFCTPEDIQDAMFSIRTI